MAAVEEGAKPNLPLNGSHGLFLFLGLLHANLLSLLLLMTELQNTTVLLLHQLSFVLLPLHGRTRGDVWYRL